ncbi:hypothetical protein [Paraburkholderia aromaticivorans]|uniref:hypothetical protein n=1 Tax=Paraburkholderia aromaticivorans TaxID=2026199 RepID=UPI0019824099|nr:hypothetical protein [Paraburkholderia aromaticivorans]
MNHQHIENELSYLERMLPHFAHGPFPIAYWTKRIDSLKPSNEIRSQHLRLSELKKKVREL